MIHTESPDFYVINGMDYRQFIETDEQEYLFHKIKEEIEKAQHQTITLEQDVKVRNMCRQLLRLPELKLNFATGNQLN